MDSFMNFLDESNIFLIPPYLEDQKERIESIWSNLKLDSHIFIFSSGTTSKKNLTSYALSKKSLLENAAAVNERLKVTNTDRWLSSLPKYHIGGLSIFARAHLSNSDVYIPVLKLNSSRNIMNELEKYKINFFSLIPQQLYLLVKDNIKAPHYVKGVLIGGDYLPKEIASRAIELGWSLYYTYGMTEACSQIATSFYDPDDEHFIELLPIHLIEGDILKSNSLYTAKISIYDKDFLVDYQKDNQFVLPDNFELLQKDNQWIRPLGRTDERIKIKGRLLGINELKDLINSYIINENLYNDVHLQINIEGVFSELILFATTNKKSQIESLEKTIFFNLPYLKDILKIKYVEKLIKTSIGKTKRM